MTGAHTEMGGNPVHDIFYARELGAVFEKDVAGLGGYLQDLGKIGDLFVLFHGAKVHKKFVFLRRERIYPEHSFMVLGKRAGPSLAPHTGSLCRMAQ